MSVTDTACGLNHIIKFKEHTGRYPTQLEALRLYVGCTEWKRRLDEVKSMMDQGAGSTLLGALELHGSVSRLWNAHLAQMGVPAR
jgi:hypothetical protein